MCVVVNCHSALDFTTGQIKAYYEFTIIIVIQIIQDTDKIAEYQQNALLYMNASIYIFFQTLGIGLLVGKIISWCRRLNVHVKYALHIIPRPYLYFGC